MFSSEIGIFNGEGYHADKGGANQENEEKLSIEWRLTGHLLGSGEKVGKNDRTKDTYANISTYGLISHNHKDDKADLLQTSSSEDNPLKVEYDRSFYGIHAVYNQPEFLIAGQYAVAKDDVRDPETFTGAINFTERNYDVWSINAEIRPFQDWTIIGRYDNYEIEHKSTNQPTYTAVEGDKIIAALAYKYNKNVTFIGSAKFIDEDRKNYDGTVAADESKDVYMLTTEVKW